MDMPTSNPHIPPLRRVGQTVYVGLQLPLASAHPLDIADQTDQVFRSLVARLEEAGGAMADLTKLHTYYLFDGDGTDVTAYWERMTAVRLLHLADPGPAATALRTQGVGPDRALIAVDGIAELGQDKQRIMPAHAWDWSIPTPFSQGWRVGTTVYVGGQISADRQGRTIAAGDVEAQTRNTLEYIEHVLRDARTDWDKVCSLKIAYRHDADASLHASQRLGESIVAEAARRFAGPKPAITVIGVDLLYEGLLLEIDAVASTEAGEPVSIAGETGATPFSPGWRAGNALHIAAQAAPEADGLAAQLEGALTRVATVAQAGGAAMADIVKLNVFLCPGESAQTATEVLHRFLVPGRTVVSIVQVAGFLTPGQRVQIDGLAILGQDASA
ncbi:MULTISPECIES: RidA family protein [unclassified Cupriavidus]|uniref:RidA family protein n=1 Tax=unclassified Cupriavidus TaxID=2640874 RepID=UPI00313C89AB